MVIITLDALGTKISTIFLSILRIKNKITSKAVNDADNPQLSATVQYNCHTALTNTATP